MKNTTPEWEIEFDILFFQDKTGEKCENWLACFGDKIHRQNVGTNYYKIANPNDVKVYIRSLLSSHTQRIKERIEGMKIKYPSALAIGENDSIQRRALIIERNETLDEVLSALED